MLKKELYVLLDSDQDIVETFPENSGFDHMFNVKQSTCPSGAIHRATLIVGQEEHERPHTTPPKLSATVPVTRRRLVARWRNSAAGEKDKDIEREREILGEDQSRVNALVAQTEKLAAFKKHAQWIVATSPEKNTTVYLVTETKTPDNWGLLVVTPDNHPDTNETVEFFKFKGTPDIPYPVTIGTTTTSLLSEHTHNRSNLLNNFALSEKLA